MVATKTNGNGTARAVVQVLTGLVVILVASGVAYALRHSQDVSACLHNHEQLQGHPAIVERVDAMRDDLSEIKADVKELLKRK